ncbi:tetratricopeptide repeat protein [Saccharothrix xinjiangensis]|uniref:Tetratricopeptide repeat protein n=1 Tax=Saccharothrix xinjiangensis TaxID=204798 RepID=A0ABV9Y7N0_9PSEU
MTEPRKEAVGSIVFTANQSSTQYNVANGSLNVHQYGPGQAAVSPVDPPELPVKTLRGRDELVAAVLAAARGRDGKPWVLHGLGGSGKSTVAMAVAAELRGERDVYWISGDVHTAMITVAERRGADPGDVQRARANWQEAHALVWGSLNRAGRPWLLVFDDVDDPTELAGPSGNPGDGTGWLRSSAAGFALVTSRFGGGAWGDLAEQRRVDLLDAGTGAAVLLDRAPDAGPVEDARLLSERLGGLPLALWLAGGYLRSGDDRHRTFAEYRQALDEDLVDLIDRGGVLRAGAASDDTEARKRVLETWELSLRMLERKGFPAPREVVKLLSCFGAPHPIRAELLDAARELEGSALAGLSEGDLDQTLGGLAAVALVDRARVADVRCFALHPLVSEVVAETVVRPEERDALWWTAQRCLTGVTPGDVADPAVWPSWVTLPAVYQHLLAEVPGHLTDVLAEVIEGATGPCALRLSNSGALKASHDLTQLAFLRSNELPVDHVARLGARFSAALINSQEGNYGPVEGELRALYAEASASYPPQAPLVTAIVMNLTGVLCALGRTDEAAELFAVLPPAYEAAGEPLPLGVRMVRAQLHSQLGDFEAAELGLAEVLEAQRAELGEEHPNTLVTMASLAEVAAARGRLNEAQRELERVLRVQVRLFGPDNAATLATRSALFGVLAYQGDLTAAHGQLNDLLKIQRDSLNPENPLSLLGLAALTSFQSGTPGNESAAAERRLRDLVSTMARTLGAEHPTVLVVRFLAVIQVHLNDRAAAEAECAEIAGLQTAALGAEHPVTLSTRLVLALMRCHSDPVTGEEQLRELHGAFRRALGDDHPQTIQILHSLANTSFRHGDLANTERFLRAAVAGLERLRGPDHEDVQETRTVLVEVLVGRDEHEEAQRELRALIESVERTRGPESEESLGTRFMLAALRYDAEDLAGAERELRSVAEVLRRVHGEDHGGWLVTEALLGELLHVKGDLALAEGHLRTALAGFEAGWGVEDEDALLTRVELGEVLHDRGDLAGAEQNLQLAVRRLADVEDVDEGVLRRAENSLSVVTAELHAAQPEPPAAEPTPVLEPTPEPVAPEPPSPDLSDAWRLLITGDVAGARAVFEGLGEVPEAAREALRRALDGPGQSAVDGVVPGPALSITAPEPEPAPELAPELAPEPEPVAVLVPESVPVPVPVHDPVPAGGSERELRSLLRERWAEHGMAHPATTRVWRQFALVLLDGGFPLAALGELTALLGALEGEEDQFALRVRLDVAHLRFEQGDASRALRDLDRVHRAAEVLLGGRHRVTLRAGARRALARRDLRGAVRALEVDGALADVRFGVAVLAHELGDRDRVERECTRLVREQAGEPRALRARALLAASRGDHAELAEVVRAQEARRGPNHPEVAETRHLLGLALIAAGLPGGRELHRALEARTRRLGPRHPATVATAAALATG